MGEFGVVLGHGDAQIAPMAAKPCGMRGNARAHERGRGAVGGGNSCGIGRVRHERVRGQPRGATSRRCVGPVRPGRNGHRGSPRTGCESHTKRLFREVFAEDSARVRGRWRGRTLFAGWGHSRGGTRPALGRAAHIVPARSRGPLPLSNRICNGRDLIARSVRCPVGPISGNWAPASAPQRPVPGQTLRLGRDVWAQKTAEAVYYERVIYRSRL